MGLLLANRAMVNAILDTPSLKVAPLGCRTRYPFPFVMVCEGMYIQYMLEYALCSRDSQQIILLEWIFAHLHSIRSFSVHYILGFY